MSILYKYSMPMKTRHRKAWRKILWEKQDYPDNYCGPEFLEGLKTNVTAETYGFWQSVRGSCIFIEQIDTILIYVIIFCFVHMDLIDWTSLLASSLFLLVTFYTILFKFPWQSGHEILLEHGKTLAVFVAFGYGMSPVLKTLTETISTDTIYAMATLMFLLSLVFYDYGVDVAIVSSSMSLNCSIFGAVCLISRLPSSNHSFALLAICLELFVLFPMVRRKATQTLTYGDVWVTVILSVMVLTGLTLISPVGALLFLVVHAFISFVCPWWLIIMQPLKSTIHGPWDEAVIEEENQY